MPVGSSGQLLLSRLNPMNVTEMKGFNKWTVFMIEMSSVTKVPTFSLFRFQYPDLRENTKNEMSVIA